MENSTYSEAVQCHKLEECEDRTQWKFKST